MLQKQNLANIKKRRMKKSQDQIISKQKITPNSSVLLFLKPNLLREMGKKSWKPSCFFQFK